MAEDGAGLFLDDLPPFDLECGRLPDLIDLLEFCVHEQDGMAGLPAYALRVLDELDRDALRRIYDEHDVAISWNSRRRSYRIEYDRSYVVPSEELVLLQAETVINRLVRLSKAAPGLSEEDCADADLDLFQQVTAPIPTILNGAGCTGRWARPGTVLCEPGGEWDVRTRLAGACERLSPLTRLDCHFSCDASRGLVAIEFVAPDESAMPHSRCTNTDGSGLGGCRWVPIDVFERGDMAREYASRISLVLAAVAFAAGAGIQRCSVDALDVISGRSLSTFVFDRGHFLSVYVPFARSLEHESLLDGVCSRALKFAEGERVLPDVRDDGRWVRPADDFRPLPDDLRSLLLAETMDELDTEEPVDDSSMRQFETLYMLVWVDPLRAIRKLSRFIGELEGKCAASEFESGGTEKLLYCDTQMERILLPLAERGDGIRIRRAPSALYYAECELVRLYMGLGEYDLALTEAHRLIDLAPTSTEAHFILVNALARLERYDEVIEACKHGLLVACTRLGSAYLYYRMAFAYWNMDDLRCALACYCMVPEGEKVSAPAKKEMGALLDCMGRTEPFSPEEAEAVLHAAGVPVQPVPEVFDQIADAAVLLCDNGFFWLAEACVEQLQVVTGSAELDAVARSLRPR